MMLLLLALLGILFFVLLVGVICDNGFWAEELGIQAKRSDRAHHESHEEYLVRRGAIKPDQVEQVTKRMEQKS